jgi:hypothetical protein
LSSQKAAPDGLQRLLLGPSGAVVWIFERVCYSFTGVAGGIGVTRLLRLLYVYLAQYMRRRASMMLAWVRLRRIAAMTPPIRAAKMAAAAMNMNMVHLSREKIGRVALEVGRKASLPAKEQASCSPEGRRGAQVVPHPR